MSDQPDLHEQITQLRARLHRLEGECMFWRELIVGLSATVRPPMLQQFQQEVDHRLRRMTLLLRTTGAPEQMCQGLRDGDEYHRR